MNWLSRIAVGVACWCLAGCAAMDPSRHSSAYEAFQRAYAKEDWAKAAAETELARGDSRADDEPFHWHVAEVYEKLGQLDLASRTYEQIVFQYQEPDAAWAAARTAKAAGTSSLHIQEHGRAAENKGRVKQALLASTLELAHRRENGESIDPGAFLQVAKVAADQAQDFRREKDLAACMAGDLYWHESNWPAQAAVCYDLCERRSDCIRVRKADVALRLGDVDRAKRIFDELPDYYRPNPFCRHRALQIELAAAVSAKRQLEQQQHAARLAKAPPPAGFDLLQSLSAVKGLRRTPVPQAEGKLRFEGLPMIDIVHDAAEGRLGFKLDFRLLAQIEAGVFEITAKQDDASMSGSWDPVRQCFTFHVLADASTADSPRVVFHGNGDVFVGWHRFAGYGVYLSPHLPAYAGACQFGLPPQRAMAIVVLEQAGKPSDERPELAARLADGGLYIGKGKVVENRLFPDGYARIYYRGLGAFVGEFKDGMPDSGAFVRNDAGIEVLAQGRTAYVKAGGRELGDTHAYDPPILSEAPRMQWRPTAAFVAFEYFDPRSGMLLTLTPDLLQYSAKFDDARLQEYRRQNRIAADDLAYQERLAAQREEQRSIARQMQMQWERDHPDWREGHGDSTGAGGSNASVCMKCYGSGQRYVPGLVVTSGSVWVPDALSVHGGSWRTGQLRSEGAMGTCDWCNGSGRR